MASYCGYFNCLLTVLFLGRTIGAPHKDDLPCAILDDLYSSNGDFSQILVKCANPKVELVELRYCKELISIHERICAFQKGETSATDPKIFTFPVKLKGGEAICEDFKTLNMSLYNIYLDEPDFIGKRLSEDLMCHLFCAKGKQTECELLLRTYWIWKVLQDPKKGTQNPDDSLVVTKNEESKKGNSFDSSKGSKNRDQHPKDRNDLKKGDQPIKGRNETEVSKEQLGKQTKKSSEVTNENDVKGDVSTEQQENQNAQNQPAPVSAVSNVRKLTEPLDINSAASGETTHKPVPTKPSQNNNNNINVPAPVDGRSGNPSPDNRHSGNPPPDNGHSGNHPSPDKSNDHVSSTDGHKHVNITSKGASAEPKDEPIVKDKDDNKLKTGGIEATKLTEEPKRPEMDENPTKETTEGKQSTSNLATKPGNDGNHGNDDEEISHDSEKVSDGVPAPTVGEAEFGNPINEFDDGYEGQDNEYPEGGSTDEHESPSSGSKTSQSGSLDESKSDAKTPHDNTKAKEQVNDFPTEESGHFFAYFLAIVVLCIAGYLVFHNKQKIIALIVEGRHERRRRPNNGTYKRLDSKDSGKATSHVIF